MEIGDLVWSRDRGLYYLARVAGPWRCCDAEEHHRADMMNFRSCERHEVGAEADVPGEVVRNVRG